MSISDCSDLHLAGLALLLGRRRAEVMRFLWTHGAATARTIYDRLGAPQGLAYTTIKTTCDRLVEKGLLDQQRETIADRVPHFTTPTLYIPRISEAAFVHQAVTQQLDALLAHFPVLVVNHLAQATLSSTMAASTPQEGATQYLQTVLDTLQDADRKVSVDAAQQIISALVGRADIAERQAATWTIEVQQAQQQTQAATIRADRAEQRAATWEVEARRAQQQRLWPKPGLLLAIDALHNGSSNKSIHAVSVGSAVGTLPRSIAMMGYGSALIRRVAEKRAGVTTWCGSVRFWRAGSSRQWRSWHETQNSECR